jgi:4'-phosphopantetheinyl transferase EntD
VGVDAEVVSAVSEDIWPEIMTPRERTAQCRLAESFAQAFAATVFSAKEAFFKAQFPLTGTWLDFHDVEVEIAEGEFRAHTRDPITHLPTANPPPLGRYQLQDGYILAGYGLPA